MRKLIQSLFIAIIICPTILSSQSFYKADTRLNVRSGEGTYNRVLFVLDKGDEVELLESNDRWFKIKYNDKIGYVSSDYLTKIYDSKDESLNNSQLDKINKNDLILYTAIFALVIIVILLSIKSKTTTEEDGEDSKIKKSTKGNTLLIFLLVSIFLASLFGIYLAGNISTYLLTILFFSLWSINGFGFVLVVSVILKLVGRSFIRSLFYLSLSWILLFLISINCFFVLTKVFW